MEESWWLLAVISLIITLIVVVSYPQSYNPIIIEKNVTINNTIVREIPQHIKVVRLNDSESPKVLIDCEYAIGNNLTLVLYGYDETLLNVGDACKFLYQKHYEGVLN